MESSRMETPPPPSRKQSSEGRGEFQMPLHYPRYSEADYGCMPEWKLDLLLKEYGLPVFGDIDEKRKFAMGAFLWPRLHC